MNLLSRFAKLFKNKPSTDANKKWLVGHNAFERGKASYFAKPMREQEALDCFDMAIGCGFENAEVYDLRGSCLQSAKFDFDAIEDFSRAISMQPEDCNFYYQRSISKAAVGDLAGCAADLNEAVRLSKYENARNRNYDIAAREMGHRYGVTAFYEVWLESVKLEIKTIGEVDELRRTRATARRRSANVM
jgi:tetratricopeptide (TPR) repeat protein